MPEQSQGYIKYFPADKKLFDYRQDIWKALDAGFELTLNDAGLVVNVWDSVNKKEVDFVYGNPIKDQLATFTMPLPRLPAQHQTADQNKEEWRRLRVDMVAEGKSIKYQAKYMVSKQRRIDELDRALRWQLYYGMGRYRRRYRVFRKLATRVIYTLGLPVKPVELSYPSEPPDDE